MKGRKPKPTILKMIEGNPGKRALNTNEPQPSRDMPEVPDFLSEEAQAEWDRVTPELHRLGLLTVVDRAALAAYCSAWGNFYAAQKVVNQAGPGGAVYKSDSGCIRAIPHVAMANEAMSQIRAFCTEFGLSPSARGRMQLPSEAMGESKLEKMLRGG